MGETAVSEKATFQQIKADLVDWPDDVIQQWLLFYAQPSQAGWPPPESLVGSRWKYLISRPLSWWRNVSWELESLSLEASTFSLTDQHTLIQMYRAYFEGEHNSYSAILDGPDRASSVFKYIYSIGKLPKPPIAMEATGGLTFVDGSHRVVAWLAYVHQHGQGRLDDAAIAPVPLQNVWVGRHGSGELFR